MAALNGLLRLCCDAHDRSSWRFTGSSPAPFMAKVTERSDVGLFAARDVCAGERVLAETPLATWCVAADATNAEKLRSFEDMVARLPPQTAAAIYKLSQSPRFGASKTLLGTWQTNGLPINYESETRPGTTTSELLSKKEAAVYKSICRLNHSCMPNCHAEWNCRLGKQTVHALVAIPVGRELTICYLPPRGFERELRRSQLFAEHGFQCGCARCSLTGDMLAASEARQRAIGALHRPADAKLPMPDLVKRLDVRLRLMSEEGMPHLWAWKPLLYPLVVASRAELMRDTGPACWQRVASWAERAHEVFSSSLGMDHPASELVASILREVGR